MKKVLALLALALATLPSRAADTLQFLALHARIGTAATTAVSPNKGLITAERVDDSKEYTYVASETAPSNILTIAQIPAGQEFRQWWFYYYTGWDSCTTNTSWWGAATGETNIVWRYQDAINPSDYYVHIVADFSYIDYKLHYNGNGGGGNMSQESHVYTNVFNLASNQFTKTGYTFGGWTNETITTALADQSSASGAVFGVTYTNKTATLYAQWTPNSYRVKFNKNADDATGSMSDQPFTYDVAQNLSANGFSRDGYVFSGWTNATGTVYADQASVKNLASENGAEIELFAKWTQLWTVTFRDSSLFDDEVLSENTYEHGQALVYPSANPSHSGYTFTGWTPSPQSSVTGNATYTATYSANAYKVVLHSNYGDDATSESSFTYGTGYNIPSTILGITSRTGYTLLGWATQSDAQAKEYDPGASGVLFTTAGPVDLYAVWAPIAYTIAFDKNGGEGTMAALENVSYDTEVVLPACTFEKSGVDFKCWRLGGDSYADGATVSNLTTKANATVTFSAVWSEKCYVAFDGNGGEGEMTVQMFDAEELPSALTSNAFTKVGYTFSGWATNAADAANLTVAYADGRIFETFAALPAEAGEMATLFAVWATNTYTVVFDPNCTSYTGEMDAQDFAYDQEQALTANAFVNAAGLTFAGWTNYTDSVGYEDGATVSNLTAEAGGTVTLSAVWDVGDLSRAMHCDNLYWKNFDAKYHVNWTAINETGVGDNSDSCVYGSEIGYMMATVTTNGVLRFSWRSTTGTAPAVLKDSGNLVPWNSTEIATLSNRTAGVWNDSGAIEIKLEEGAETLTMVLRFDDLDGGTCYIDQMTWTPTESAVEPTEADRPVVSGFTPATTGGFTLSVDPSNVSDSFSYQILATNELVGGEWPVKANLSADDLKAGYAITPEADAPTMFYKVKVIAK